jgi:hypothetical protein
MCEIVFRHAGIVRLVFWLKQNLLGLIQRQLSKSLTEKELSEMSQL